MRTQARIAVFAVTATVVLSGGVSRAAEATLQDAIKARTEVTVLREETNELPAEVRRPMRKVIAKGEAQEMAGNILLMKDKYAEAVKAYKAAAAFYRKALNGRQILQCLAQAREKAARARMLAEAFVEPEKLKAPRRLELNADGYEQAGEFDLATAELNKAAKAYESLLAPAKPTTLEEVVAARTAMISARKQVRDLAKFRIAPPARRRPGIRPEPPGARRGSLADLLVRAVRAEAAAAEALEGREYTPARALFALAEKLYRQAAALQVKRDKVVAARKTAEDSMKLADAAFQTEGRPASFERGKQCLEDGSKALADEDLDKAKRLFSDAVGHFAKARAEAALVNDFAKAQEAWAAAVVQADEVLLDKHAARDWAAAICKAADARNKAREGKLQAATVALKGATGALKRAVAKAVTAENAPKAAPVIRRLEQAVQRKDKFAAEDILEELEKLIPADGRMPQLREKVSALPGPKKRLILDLGGGVKMHFVVIRPGSFMMGSPASEAKRGSDEGPQHRVTISRAFYMGIYEVTQEQYQAVMGSNPSRLKGTSNPVESVSWYDAVAFCRKLSARTGKTVRLPTEAQWEYACRAGTTTPFNTGKTISTNQANYNGNYTYGTGRKGVYRKKTMAVGSFRPNKWGLYDMHGNVWEWCSDWYANSYANAKKIDPTGPASGLIRVLRGGCRGDNPWNCRSAHRYRRTPDHRSGNVGLRIVISLD